MKERFTYGLDFLGILLALLGRVLLLGLVALILYTQLERIKPVTLPACEQIFGGDPAVYARLKNGGYELSVGGMRHFNFTDAAILFSPVHHLEGLLGSIDGKRGLTITAVYVGAFFDKYLDGASASLLNGLYPDYPEVRFCSTFKCISGGK